MPAGENAAHRTESREKHLLATLWEPIRVGQLNLRNRIVMAPLTRNRSPHAIPGDMAVTYYSQRASAGLIMTEATAISHQGQGYSDVPGLYGAGQLRGWRRVTDAVHEAGGTIAVQLWHVGRISHAALQPGGQPPVAPSAVVAKAKTYLTQPDGTGAFVPTSEPRQLERDEIKAIVDDFARAAQAAIAVGGFDGVEIHGANGYLVDQFLRANSNLRDDDYGGSIENRTRFLDEVVGAVAAQVGASRVGIRLSPVSPANDAFDPEPQRLFAQVMRILARHDAAFVHIIEGATGGDRDHMQGERPFDYLRLREDFRSGGGRGAWIVNNGYDGASAAQAVESGRADLVSFGRHYIANPDLVRRLREGLPLAVGNRKTYYGGGAEGYVDYAAA